MTHEIEKRLAALELKTAERRQRNDPRRCLHVATQLAMMHATVPAGPDGSPERLEQLARVDRLERAYQAGDPSAVKDDLVELGFAGSEPWRPIHVEQPTPPSPLEN